MEVSNTDAEGRLVLGDGVAWAAANLAPKVRERRSEGEGVKEKERRKEKE